jgi:hypothetical protein
VLLAAMLRKHRMSGVPVANIDGSFEGEVAMMELKLAPRNE